MKLSLLVPAAPMAQATRPATTSLLAARWRLALEQAQWQQTGDRSSLPRPSGAVSPPAASPGGAAAGWPVPAVSMADTLPTRIPTSVATSGGAAPAAPVEAATTASSARAAALPSPIELGIAAPAAWPLPTIPSSTASAGSVPAAEARNAALLPAPPECIVATPWPPFNAQAHVDGRSVSAAVRDPNLDASDADDLERRLARQLAADGLELVELRVNGRLAGRADRPADQI